MIKFTASLMLNFIQFYEVSAPTVSKKLNFQTGIVTVHEFFYPPMCRIALHLNIKKFRVHEEKKIVCKNHRKMKQGGDKWDIKHDKHKNKKKVEEKTVSVC